MCKSFIPAAQRALIRSAVQAGASIEYLEGAPRFRFVPVAKAPEDYGKPSKRTLAFKRKPHMKGLRTWRSPGLEYGEADMRIPMRGDPAGLTKARKAWGNGDPMPLRQWLSSQATKAVEPLLAMA